MSVDGTSEWMHRRATDAVASVDLVRRYLVARADGASQNGAALVEYALLVAFIAMACIAAVTFLGNTLSNKYSSIGSGFSD